MFMRVATLVLFIATHHFLFLDFDLSQPLRKEDSCELSVSFLRNIRTYLSLLLCAGISMTPIHVQKKFSYGRFSFSELNNCGYNPK